MARNPARTSLGTIGTSVEVSTDGMPEAKIGAASLDWAAFAAVTGTAVTLLDGIVVPVGGKFCRYGQMIQLITASGLYGPYDPAAAGTGREVAPSNGLSFIVNRTLLEEDGDDPEAIVGGRVWLARILQAGTGTASLAAGPTLANLVAAFPRLILVRGT